MVPYFNFHGFYLRIDWPIQQATFPDNLPGRNRSTSIYDAATRRRSWEYSDRSCETPFFEKIVRASVLGLDWKEVIDRPAHPEH